MSRKDKPVQGHPAEGSVITISPLRTLEEVAAMRAAILNHPGPTTARDAALFTAGVRTNLRASDLLNLKPTDIDWMTGLLTVRESKTKKVRHIPLSPDTIALLAPLSGSEYLFPGHHSGKPMTISTLNHLVKLWAIRANLHEGTYGARTLRKTWATIQVTVFKVPVYLISQQLNHSSEAMTYRYLGIQTEQVAELYARDI
jgi:integrase